MQVAKQVEMRHLPAIAKYGYVAPPTRDLNVWLCALDRFKRYAVKVGVANFFGSIDRY